MNQKSSTKKHWIVLIITALMIGASIGLVTNVIGVFYAPMARDLNVLLGSVSMHGTLTSLAMAFSSLSVPMLSEKLGFKKMLILGMVLAAGGTFLMSTTSHLFLIYFYATVRGIGAGYFAYVPMSMVLNQWFEEKNGLAIGLAAGTSGIAGALSAPFLTFIIEHFNWRMGFIINSLLIVLFMLPIIFYPFTLNPRDEDLLPYGHQPSRERKIIHRSEVKDVPLTNFIFIALMVVGFLNTLLVFMNAHFPGYAENLGFNSEIGSLMLSGAMVGNLVWKTIYGYLSDRIGTIKTSLFIMILSFVSILLIIFWPSPLPLIFGSFLFGASFSIGGVGMPILSNKFFGPVAGAKVYAVVNFLASAGGAVGVALAGYVYDFTGTYIIAFALGFMINLVNATLLIFAKRSYDTQKVS